MDVIILAAGENLRLQGAGLAPGMKPLLLVENEVLIRRLCRQAYDVAGPQARIIVVCNPDNAREVVFASNGYATDYVIQPTPTHPCEAVDRAWPLTRSPHLMLLMADNYIGEMPHLVDNESPVIVVTRQNDEHLSPLCKGEFQAWANQDTDAWWLGPIMFPRDVWGMGAITWLEVFDGLPFQYRTRSDVKDMGVLL